MQKLRNNKSVPRLGCKPNHHQSSSWRGGGLRQRLTLVKLANCVGSASAVALGLLALVLLSPNIAGFASAESATTKLPVEVQAGYMLSLAMDHNSVSMEGLIPTREGVFSAQSVKLTVETNATDGYKLYVNTASENNALTKVSEGSVGTIESLSAVATSDNFPKDKWGYSLVEGENQPSTYNPVPSSSATGTPVETKNAKHQDYTLGFATKVSTDIPAGTYRNEVVVSAVTNPETIITLDKITTMQEMTPQVCANTLATNAADLPAGSRQIVTPGNEPSKQLMDTRDNKWYWVSKLADQNCWMTQNLDLDIPETITPEFASLSDNMSSSWKPTAATITSGTISQTNIGYATSSFSWDFGNYRFTQPEVNNPCNVENTMNISLSCDGRIATTPALTDTNILGNEDIHYHLGNYYQWNTATAGTGASLDTEISTNSICPKHWSLPNVIDESSYQKLISVYNPNNSDGSQLIAKPLYLNAGGAINPFLANVILAGQGGGYWINESTGPEHAFGLSFHSDDINATTGFYKSMGNAVRCIAN